jgi:hypothetical protein
VAHLLALLDDRRQIGQRGVRANHHLDIAVDPPRPR